MLWNSVSFVSYLGAQIVRKHTLRHSRVTLGDFVQREHRVLLRRLVNLFLAISILSIWVQSEPRAATHPFCDQLCPFLGCSPPYPAHVFSYPRVLAGRDPFHSTLLGSHP